MRSNRPALARHASERIAAKTVPTDPLPRAEEALRRGVLWLVKHQNEDGSWSLTDGKKSAGMETQTSLTARALMALNEADQRAGTDASRTARDKAVRWLETHQDDAGCFGSRKSFPYLYGHALAILALCSEQERAPTPGRLQVITKAIAFTLEAQNPYQGWRYGIRDGDNDSKMTTLMLMGLRNAAKLGIDVPGQALEMGRCYIDAMIDDDTGRVGWVKRGGPVGRLKETWRTHPPEHSEEVTALVLVSWLDAGRNPAKDRRVRKGLSVVLDKLPRWNEHEGTIDYAVLVLGHTPVRPSRRLAAKRPGRRRTSTRSSPAPGSWPTARPPGPWPAAGAYRAWRPTSPRPRCGHSFTS